MVHFNFKNISILSLVFFILLFLRRGAQLLHPQIWNEDGPFNMRSFIEHGWHSLYEPTQGYLVLIPKLITNLSMSISFIYYPEVSTYLTWIFTIMLALAIVYAPTMLRYPVLMAISIFLIPINAEPYGLPLYTLWFSAILLFLVALWIPQKRQILKNILLLLGGLSSPVIVIMVPIQLFRTIVQSRKKEEIFTLILSIVLSLIQLSFVMQKGVRDMMHIDIPFVQSIVYKFFGFYYMGVFDVGAIIILLAGLYLVILILVYFLKNRKDVYFMILVYLLFASIALSSARMNPATLTPIFGGGSRYFFLPYILLSWTLIYMMAKNKWYEIVILPVIILSIVSAMQGFCRGHEDLLWRKHIAQCQESEGKYNIPIQNNGKAKYAWSLRLDSKICKRYIENDIFKLPEMEKK